MWFNCVYFNIFYKYVNYCLPDMNYKLFYRKLSFGMKYLRFGYETKILNFAKFEFPKF